MTLTSVRDLAAAIVRAVGHTGKWPATGGIRGNRLTFAQIIAVGEEVRGESRPSLVNCQPDRDGSGGGEGGLKVFSLFPFAYSSRLFVPHTRI
jgi:hypothetical protein